MLGLCTRNNTGKKGDPTLSKFASCRKTLPNSALSYINRFPVRHLQISKCENHSGAQEIDSANFPI